MATLAPMCKWLDPLLLRRISLESKGVREVIGKQEECEGDGDDKTESKHGKMRILLSL